MKNNTYKIKAFAGAVLLGLALSGCSDILDETPRSTLTPEYFKTEDGVKGGVTALYASLRYVWGQGYWLNAMETGTDEYTYGQSADENFKVMDLTGQGEITATNSRADVIWGTSFTNINTANGILENGSSIAGIPASLLAEAHFFRGFDYFNLVQTFGGVPLDLGSGELKFNTSTVRTSKRNTVPEVYTKAVFPDLLTAVKDLPDAARVTGGVTKTTARLFLAKAYLTYGWWLQNPNDIPTYPECQRTDPDGHDAAWYFQQAYNVAVEAIKTPGSYGLMESFYEVNAGQYDRNKECLLYADHTQDSEYYDGGGTGSFGYASGGAPGNFARWMPTWNYTQIRSSVNSTDFAAESVQREGVQGYDRPWTRMAPIIEAFTKTFKDKTYDSRYDGTFQYQFRGNWNKSSKDYKDSQLYNANGMKVSAGDPILTFLDEDNPEVKYPDGKGQSGVGGGTLPGRADWVINPSGISRVAYPNLWKIGMYRTDNGSGLGMPNGNSPRPYVIAKFSELYLLAAEAAVKGAKTEAGYSARELVNVLRARAGRWTYDNNGCKAKDADYSAEMTAATPAQITIDYILDERSREFFGEGLRWWDLVRTQTWNERAGTYTICGTNLGDHTPKVYTRTIDKNKYLRPIPQGQLDALDMTEAEKAEYQNPGY